MVGTGGEMKLRMGGEHTYMLAVRGELSPVKDKLSKNPTGAPRQGPYDQCRGKRVYKTLQKTHTAAKYDGAR